MSDDGFVAGEIIPNGERHPARYRIVGRKDDKPGPNVRACPHPHLVLDDRWNTVTCDKCGERLDAYAVLRNDAERLSELRFERAMTERAHADFYRDLLRQTSRRRGLTDGERAEATALLQKYPRATSAELKALDRRLERAANERRRTPA